jgi:type VI secretion system protein ImpL
VGDLPLLDLRSDSDGSGDDLEQVEIGARDDNDNDNVNDDDGNDGHRGETLMDLSTIWPWALAAILLFALLILFLLIILLRRASKPSQFVDADETKDEAKPDDEEPIDSGLVVEIPEAFRRAASLIDRSGDGDRNEVPLVMLVGTEASRDADMFSSGDCDMTWGPPGEAGTALGNGRGFWFFDRGVVLDVAGDYILNADGKSSDEGGWSSILKHLRELRPKRPIDSVIVTFSCAELLEAAASEVRRADLGSRAGKIFRKLFEAQQELGFRLPTYVLITGAQRLIGFKAFCAAFPVESRHEILGWSSPYGIESVFRGAWVDDGFKTLAGRIDELQMEAFATRTIDPSALLRFPPAVQSLLPAVRTALDNLFKSSAYQGTLIFRGVYFVGRETMSSDEDEKPAGKIAFLRDVLDRKIFIEHRLAAPTARTVLARNRSVRIAKICAAAAWGFCAFAVLWASISFKRQNLVLEPLMNQARLAVHARRAITADGEVPSTSDSGTAALSLLNGMSQITFSRYDSIFVPVSWVSPFQDDIQDALGASFHEIVLRAIRAELYKKSKYLVPEDPGRIVPAQNVMPPAPQPAATPASIIPAALTTTPATNVPLATAAGTMVVVDGDPSMVWAQQPLMPIKGMTEFTALQKFVADVKELDENGRTFNRLREADDLHDLGKLVKYAFGRDLPESFYSDSEFYKRAVLQQNYRPFELDNDFRRRAANKLGRLSDDFHDAVFRRNPFAARLQRLSSSLQEIIWQPPAAGDPQPLTNISQQLKRIESDLTGPDLEWAFHREFNLGSEYNGVLNDIGSSTTFGSGVSNQVRDATAARWGRFQQGLAWASSPLTKTILAVQQDKPEAHLSNDALLLESALNAFLGQSFVTSTRQGSRLRTDLPDGKRMEWNGPLLDEAVAVSQSYDRFRSGSLSLFPSDLRVAIDQVARDRALADMFNFLSQAQVFSDTSQDMSEDALRLDVLRFTAEEHSLEPVLDACAHLRAPDAASNVAEAMNAEAYRLLRGVDVLLKYDQPYHPRQDGFGDWDGKNATPPSPTVWGQQDAAGLTSYLDATRGRVSFLSSNYAKPVLTWLTKIEGSTHPEMRPLVAKWQGIASDLRDYEAKRPGNSVAAIEEYIGDRMTKVSLGDCSATTLQATFRPTDNYFSTTLQDLSRRLRQRCFSLAGRDAIERYARLEQYFNVRLADHYPFADHPPRAGEFEADPADLRTFFKMLDEDKSVITATPEKGGLDKDHEAARKFIGQMADVRKFFTTYIDAPKPDAEPMPSLDVEATFRVLKTKESRGDEIIGWQFGIGDNSVTNYDTVRKPLRWTAGQHPVTMSLRWAQDAPRVPMVTAAARGAVVKDRTIEWTYGGTWALLAALADHPIRPEELPSYNDLEPVTLAFDVATIPSGGKPSDAKPTRVFMRLALLAPDTKTPLKVPDFPARAPHFTTEETR